MKKGFAIFSLLLATRILSALTVGDTFRHYTVRDGLASNTVSAIIQDHMNLIWLGTDNGLDSFDGKEIIHHNGSFVQSLFEDSSLVLWIGTDEGVLRYRNDNLERIESIPETTVTAMAEDRDGNLWIATWGKGVFRFRDEETEGYLDGHSLDDIHVSRDGRVWIADSSAEESVLVYNAATRSFVSPGLLFTDCLPTRVCAIEEDGDGNLWFGTWDSGLYRIDIDSRTVHLAIPPGDGLNHIHSLTHDGAWNFLLGSDDGLLEVNLLTGEKNLHRNDRKDPASLSDTFVYPITRDHEGGLWIGTYYGGVNYVAPNQGQFSFHSLSGMLDADEDYIVSCFCEDPDGTIWIGSDNGGLFRYDPARNSVGRWTATPGWTHQLATLNIHSLLRKDDDLWVGTYSENLLRLDIRTGRIRVYGREQGLDASSVYALYVDADNTLWAGTNTGICRYESSSNRFLLEKDAGGWITDIREDDGGNFWASTTKNGILRRAPDGSWHHITADEGLPSSRVNCLQPAPQGVYAGMRQGLAFLSTEGVRTVIADEDVREIIFDGSQLWYSTGSDIARYSLQDGRRERFNVSDGVSASLFSPNAGLTARDGTVYLGAANGFVTFYPGNVLGNKIPPSVIFSRFHASGPGLFEDVFRTRGHERIILPWKLRDVRVTFAALSYCAPENIRYAYRLVDRDSDWKSLGKENSLTLSQLSPGHYRLQVIACNNSGVWNTEGASLSFTIRPHPLLSKAALTLYVLLGFLLITLLVRWLLRRTERKNRVRFERQLDEAVTQVKEEERDDRYQFVSSLADQLEAPLAGIGTQLERLKGHPKALSDIKGEITLIEKNHRMLKGVSGTLKLLRGSLAPENAPEETGQEDFLTRLDHLISENLANPALSVPFLAKEMAISRSGLFAKVKQLTGETPNNLINQTRLNAAAKLLSEGRHSVGEICYLTGFSSPSYFSKSFSAQFGFTPHEWTLMNKGE